MIEKLYEFSEINSFLKYYSPLTPYGKKQKKQRLFYTEQSELDQIYILIERMIEYVQSNPENSYKIEYHLKRIPELSDHINLNNANSEIFNIKKFLFNLKNISTILKNDTSDFISIGFFSNDLLKLLGIGDNNEESFYLGDAYSNDLKKIRKEISEISIKLKVMKDNKIQLIKDKLFLDFRFHDFLVIKEDQLPEEIDNFIFVEPYDTNSILVKPVLNQDYFHIHSMRKELLEKEKEIETRIIEEIIKTIESQKDQFSKYIQSIELLDVILAKTRLAIQFPSTKPILKKTSLVNLKKLSFIPLKEKNESDFRSYTPLTADFDSKNIVITGSNMGGKTILLKSILFSQLLVQMGFFVPGEMMKTTVFKRINFIGNISDNSINGLSSFGSEIMDFMESEIEKPSLFIVDEFARTTNSVEGKALNCAILQWFSENADIFSFSSTHQENLPTFDNLSYWNMKGLDYSKYEKYYHKDFKSDLMQRISTINEFMDYSIEPIERSENKRDAIKIADILGLNSQIIEYAKKYIKIQENKNGN